MFDKTKYEGLVSEALNPYSTKIKIEKLLDNKNNDPKNFKQVQMDLSEDSICRSV